MPAERLKVVESDGQLFVVLDRLRNLDFDVAMTVDGQVVAHDIVEHCNGIENIGSVEDELEALGAILYVRGVNGVEVDADIVTLFETTVMGELTLDWITRSRSVIGEENIVDNIMKARSRLLKGVRDEPYPEEVTVAHVNTFLEQAHHRMRKGWMKAHSRWKSWERALNQFSAIELAVNYLLKDGDFGTFNEYKLSWQEGWCRITDPVLMVDIDTRTF